MRLFIEYAELKVLVEHASKQNILILLKQFKKYHD